MRHQYIDCLSNLGHLIDQKLKRHRLRQSDLLNLKIMVLLLVLILPLKYANQPEHYLIALDKSLQWAKCLLQSNQNLEVAVLI
jgi:hypothetical protein